MFPACEDYRWTLDKSLSMGTEYGSLAEEGLHAAGGFPEREDAVAGGLGRLCVTEECARRHPTGAAGVPQ